MAPAPYDRRLYAPATAVEDFAFARVYAGPVRAVVCELEGVAADFGCCARPGAAVELFRRRGVTLTAGDVRPHQALPSRALVERLLAREDVARARKEAAGPEEPTKLARELDRIYERVLPDYGAAVPSAPGAWSELRERGCGLALTTGARGKGLAKTLASLEAEGVIPDAVVDASDAPEGPPAPWRLYRAMERLGAYPRAAVVYAASGAAQLEAGLNAGVWTVGVVATGEQLGLSAAAYAALSDEEKLFRCQGGHRRLRAAGAHHTVLSLAELPDLLNTIEQDRIGPAARR